MRTTKSKKTAVVTPVSKPVTNEHGYLKRAFCLKILIATLFLLPCVLLWVFGQLTLMDFGSILLICIAGISAMIIIYYLVGLLALKRKKKL